MPLFLFLILLLLRAMFGTGVLCDDLEQVLTLVTCSYEWESARNVLVAVRKAEVPVD